GSSIVGAGPPGDADPLTTTAAANPASWVMLRANGPRPRATANRAAAPRRRSLQAPLGSLTTSMVRQSGRTPSGRRTLMVASLAAKRAANELAATSGGPWQQEISCSV